MADFGSLGGAWVDVGLRFDKLNKDMAALPGKLAPMQKTAAAGEIKAAKNVNVELDERIKKMHEILGVSTKLAAADSAAVAKMSFVDRTMHALGAKNTGKTGMMGAQLSYALQDFVTGLSMGNLNMALMGASNNLGMMAMQISSAAAAWTTLGLVAIPLAVTAMKAFGSGEDEAKKKMEALNRLFERRRELIDLNAMSLKRLNDAEVQRIHGAEAAQGRLRTEERGLDDLNEVMNLNRTEQSRINKEIEKGTFITEVPASDKNVQALKKEQDRIQKAKASGKPVGEEFMSDIRGEILQSLGLPISGHNVSFTPEGNVEIRRRLDKNEKKAKQAESERYSKELERQQKEKENATENIKRLKARRDDEVRVELEFKKREQLAGFNPYEQGKIRLDRQQREAERDIRETYGDTILTPGMTKEERKKQIEEQYEENLRDAVKARREMEDFQAKRGRTLGLKRAKMVADIEAKALERRDKALLENEANGGVKPTTAADTMLAGSREEFRRKRIQLAEEFAGGKAGFAGIPELSKQIQTGMGGKGMTIPEQTTAIVKGQQQATKDLISFFTGTGIKIQGGGLR